MVQTDEEKVAYRKAYNLKNKDKITLRNKQYHIDNREKICLQKKNYRSKNKERIYLHNKQYNSNNPKICAISRWKSRGLKSEIYGAIYDYYKAVVTCELCGVLLTTGKRCKTTKCLDHDHCTGLFRNVVCHSCNSSLPQQKPNFGILSSNTQDNLEV